jgi:nucleoside-diphosphate-sugar epimerase
VTPRVIVVTGASGFTGPFVVRDLTRRFPDAIIRCFVRSTSKLDELRRLPVEFASGDLRDVASLRAAFNSADTLVNVASLGFDWIEPLFDAIRASNLVRGVFIGTTATLTKLPVRSRAIRERGETLVRTSGLQWTLVRPTMIYGTPADRNVARLIRFVLRSPFIPLVASRARQQPVHVEDVAKAVAAALGAEITIGRTFNIAGREPLTLEDLVRTVMRAAAVHRLIIRIPALPVRAAVALYGRVSSHPVIKVEQIDRLHEDKAFDYGEAARDFGFSPRSFEDGVRLEVAMIRATASLQPAPA